MQALSYVLFAVLCCACFPSRATAASATPQTAPAAPSAPVPVRGPTSARLPGSGPASTTAPAPEPGPVSATVPIPDATQGQFDALQAYIQQNWTTLRRSNQNLLAAAQDPKHPPAQGRWPVYIADTEKIKAVHDALLLQLPMRELQQLEIRALKTRRPHEHGILYLPHPYVVPGGRFNEMYAWDSYFIVLGLLRAGNSRAAQDMVDNAIYEVVHYGTFLNANRSYYLTRSQPPMLTGMVLAVFEKTKDRTWLASTVPALEAYYRSWNTGSHKTPTGLSRYFDSGHGPAPEVVSGETDEHGHSAYARVRDYFKEHLPTDASLARFYDEKTDKLTDAFFTGDRSMRESGFDPSARFGPFNADVTSYNPVCLNTLLVVEEQHMATIYKILKQRARQKHYESLAITRAATINRLNWDHDSGLYMDYDFIKKARLNYPFATAFYPLWAGIASAEQAAHVAHNLPLFEDVGGLKTSTACSGNQWDAPYGWAPLHLFAVDGLRRYGYHAQANRLTINFLSLILNHFIERGAIFEKYDVSVRESGNVGHDLQYGYTTNEIGFGWTNAVFAELYAQLPESLRPWVLKRQGIGTELIQGLEQPDPVDARR